MNLAADASAMLAVLLDEPGAAQHRRLFCLCASYCDSGKNRQMYMARVVRETRPVMRKCRNPPVYCVMN